MFTKRLAVQFWGRDGAGCLQNEGLQERKMGVREMPREIFKVTSCARGEFIYCNINISLRAYFAYRYATYFEVFALFGHMFASDIDQIPARFWLLD